MSSFNLGPARISTFPLAPRLYTYYTIGETTTIKKTYKLENTNDISGMNVGQLITRLIEISNEYGRSTPVRLVEYRGHDNRVKSAELVSQDGNLFIVIEN